MAAPVSAGAVGALAPALLPAVGCACTGIEEARSPTNMTTKAERAVNIDPPHVETTAQPGSIKAQSGLPADPLAGSG